MSAGLGFLIGKPVVDIAEAVVHVQLLHKPPGKRRFFNRMSAQAHTDHHKAYHGAKDYYRNARNEHEVIHFSGKNVATIAGISLGISAGVGALVEKVAPFLPGVTPDNVSGYAVAAGFMAAAAVGYGGYEFSHHFMHVIGERRSYINEVLGDLIQGGNRDGNLRYSKPVLDDICNAVEANVDRFARKELPERFSYKQSLVDRLERETESNRKKGDAVVADVSLPDVLDTLTRTMVERERTLRASHGKRESIKYAVSRFTQRLLRTPTSPIGWHFRWSDNHHFVHHSYWKKNNNVFGFLGDLVLGTRIPSSRKVLEATPHYYLCPNSADP